MWPQSLATTVSTCPLSTPSRTVWLLLLVRPKIAVIIIIHNHSNSQLLMQSITLEAHVRSENDPKIIVLFICQLRLIRIMRPWTMTTRSWMLNRNNNRIMTAHQTVAVSLPRLLSKRPRITTMRIRWNRFKPRIVLKKLRRALLILLKRQ